MEMEIFNKNNKIMMLYINKNIVTLILHFLKTKNIYSDSENCLLTNIVVISLEQNHYHNNNYFFNECIFFVIKKYFYQSNRTKLMEIFRKKFNL